MQDQGQKFDPEGEYVRSWLPELARMPTEWIHHPWDAPNSVLRAAGVELGLNYPNPIVDINTAREHLDDAVAMMWEMDRAARAGKLQGSDEVVADNLIDMRKPDIPKVVVKRQGVSCANSSHDQRVPSLQNFKSDFGNKGKEDACAQKMLKPVENNRNKPKGGTSKLDEDLHSTAESSSARKRGISESLCDVPTCSSSDMNTLRDLYLFDRPLSSGSPSTRRPRGEEADRRNEAKVV